MATTTKKPVKKGKCVKASPIIAKSAAASYFTPDIKTVRSEITADDPKFIPQYKDKVAVVKAKDAATLPHRATVSVDCGFSIKPLAGWQVVLSALPKWAAKGLIVSGPATSTDGRVKLYVTNVGKEIIVIQPGDDVAELKIEPQYLLDWITS